MPKNVEPLKFKEGTWKGVERESPYTLYQLRINRIKEDYLTIGVILGLSVGGVLWCLILGVGFLLG